MVTSNITTLPVNGVRTIRVPITQPAAAACAMIPGSGFPTVCSDAKPSNDRRVETYVPAVTK